MSRDRFDVDPDDIIMALEVSDDNTTYTLTIQSAADKPIDSHELIMAVEMWLNEITNAEITKNSPGTLVH